MEPATIESTISILDDHNKWTSSNILVPVFPSLDSDDAIEIDLCETLRGPSRETVSYEYLNRVVLGESDFQVRSESSKFGIIFSEFRIRNSESSVSEDILSECLHSQPCLPSQFCSLLPVGNKGVLAYQGLV
jgi:hypothetical protein